MSVKAMSYVWDNYKEGGSKKLVLLAIADISDNEGICYPGVKRIAEMACLSARYTQKIIRELEDSGDLRVEIGEGLPTIHGMTNRYYMVKFRNHYRLDTGEQEDTPSETGVNNRTPDGVNRETPHGVNNRTPKPSVEPSVEPITADGKIIPMVTVEKQPSVYDGMYEAVQDVFGHQKGMNKDYQLFLVGLATKPQYKPYNMPEDKPVTPDELRLWSKWYRHTELKDNPNLSMVQSPAKIQSSILKRRDELVISQQKQAKPLTRPIDNEAAIDLQLSWLDEGRGKSA